MRPYVTPMAMDTQRWQREGLLRGPHLAPEGTRSLLRVQPVYGREVCYLENR